MAKLPNRRGRRNSHPLLTLLLMVLDLAVLVVLYMVLLVARYGSEYPSYLNELALYGILGSTFVFIYLSGGYNLNTRPSSIRFFSEFLIAGILNFLTVLALVYFLADTAADRLILASTLLIFPPISLAYRQFFFRRAYRVHASRKLFILGVDDLAREFYRMLKRMGWPQEICFFDPSGRYVGDRLLSDEKHSPLIQGDFWTAIKNEASNIDTVVLAVDPKEVPPSMIEWLVSRHYVDLKVVTLDTFYTTHWKMVPLARVSPFWAFEDGFLLNHSISFERAKRLFDIACGFFGLLLLSPLLLATVLAIKLDSRGPALFRQTRIGLGQKPFTLYKFRSMRHSEKKEKAKEGDAYTRRNDDRITRVGAFLRKSRFDELPQLWNVLRGEMSIIGPRAEWDMLVDRYQRQIPYYHFRHLVKPGITGWAQVNYPYGESARDALEKLKYDLYYVRYYSFFLDLTICIKTLYVMFFGKGR